MMGENSFQGLKPKAGFLAFHFLLADEWEFYSFNLLLQSHESSERPESPAFF